MDNSEEHRHRCEVRQVLEWGAEDRSKALEYLSNVRKRRNDVAADKLEKDVRAQWALGNRGLEGDWRE